MKPNRKQLEKWIAALRSGEYKQYIGALQTSKGYCCLGVACRALIPKSKLYLYTEEHEKESFLEGILPEQQPNAPKWLKYINDDFYSITRKKLTVLNDEKKLTFDEIADLLELVYIHKILD